MPEELKDAWREACGPVNQNAVGIALVRWFVAQVPEVRNAVIGMAGFTPDILGRVADPSGAVIQKGRPRREG